MRISGILFALLLGFGLPASLFAAGVELSAARYAALVIVGTTVGGLIPAGLDFLTHDSRAEARSQREQRDANSEMTRAHAAEVWARLEQPAEVAAPVDDQTPAQRGRQFEIAHWHIFYRRLWAAAIAYGWAIRGELITREIISSDAWTKATDNMVLAGYLLKTNGGTRPTISEAEWNAGRLWEQVPCPIGEPPDIAPPPYTRQQTPQQTAAKHAVIIDGEYQKG